MKIKSNKTFECYETAFESWSNNGKCITLDGQLLIPLYKVKQARQKVADKVCECSGSGNEVTQAYCDGFKDSLKILDKLIAESEENK